MIRISKSISVFIFTAFLWSVFPVSATTIDDSDSLTSEQSTQRPCISIENRHAKGHFLAQVGQIPPPQDRPKHQSLQRHKYIEQLRLLKLLELLDLPPNQETEFIVSFRRYRKTQLKLHADRTDIVDKLALGLRDKSLPQNEVYQLVSKIEKNAEDCLKQNENFLDQARGTLNVWQYGKLAVFLNRFERELLESVKAFHDRPRRGMEQGKHGNRQETE
ncbi:MAG: hypothetical protein U9N55_07210 [candidate division Zixibacteria bacterium]|nr:hypothetical protein [candidate division Zixibacteria bacterium]